MFIEASRPRQLGDIARLKSIEMEPNNEGKNLHKLWYQLIFSDLKKALSKTEPLLLDWILSAGFVVGQPRSSLCCVAKRVAKTVSFTF